MTERPKHQHLQLPLIKHKHSTCLTRYLCSQNAKHLYQDIEQLECGPMPNVMVALPNMGGDLCSRPQSLADAKYWSTVTTVQ